MGEAGCAGERRSSHLLEHPRQGHQSLPRLERGESLPPQPHPSLHISTPSHPCGGRGLTPTPYHVTCAHTHTHIIHPRTSDHVITLPSFFFFFFQGAESKKALDEAYICLKLAHELKVTRYILEYYGAAMLPGNRGNKIQLFMEIMPSE